MAGGSRAAAGGATVPGKMKGMGVSPVVFSFLSLLVALAGMAAPAAAAVYKVGDSSGWTIIGDVNYTAWAASKTFHVGDTLVFQYNKQFHNVIEVSKADYHACNAGSPLATHTSGNDSITLKRAGHHFFLCGVPGHCALGQKVDIRIPKRASSAATPARAPSPASPSSSSSSPTSPPASGGGGGGGSTSVTGGAAPAPAPAPAPQKNGATPRVTGWALALVAVAIAAAAASSSSS